MLRVNHEMLLVVLEPEHAKGNLQRQGSDCFSLCNFINKTNGLFPTLSVLLHLMGYDYLTF